MRNIEIKAKVHNRDDLISRITKLYGDNSTLIKQHDTFYKVDQGRLKLRKFENGSGELIYYKRSDTAGPKLSSYEKTSLDCDACIGINKVLTESNGCIGIVKKSRLLYMVGQTRVHVDDVEGLGNFMELEVVLTDDQDIQDGEKIAQDLMTSLGIDSQNLIAEAYVDLLKKSESPL